MAYADAKKAGAVLGYGTFVTVAINFAIVAFVLFLVIRAMNRLVAKPAETTKEVPADVQLLAEIRDILARGRQVGDRDQRTRSKRTIPR